MPDADLRIREATAGDIDTIMGLEEGSIEHPWTRAAIEDLINDKNKLCLVIEADGEVISYVGAETVLDECNIGNIVTDKRYRGMGYGNKLMSALMDELSKRNITKVFLEVEFDNSPALALYEKQGFERYGQRRDYYGPGRDAVLMTKAL